MTPEGFVRGDSLSQARRKILPLSLVQSDESAK